MFLSLLFVIVVVHRREASDTYALVFDFKNIHSNIIIVISIKHGPNYVYRLLNACQLCYGLLSEIFLS